MTPQTNIITQRYRHDRKHIKVLVCDDSDIFILGIQTILASHYHFRVVGTARFLDELIEEIRVHRPHIVVLNEFLYNVDIMTALQQIFSACEQHRCQIRILVTGSLNDGFFIRNLMLAGVSGYLSKNDDLRPILVKALYSVIQDRAYLSATANTEFSTIQHKTKSELLKAINDETREVLRMLANGMYPRAIALKMGISERRVYRLREKLRTRFGARTNEELIRRAVAEGFVFLHANAELIH